MNTIFKLTWPYQVYAVQAIIDCIVQNCGNGKTLTFFKTSTLLKDNPAIEKCLFVVDHKDFDRQTREEFNRFQEGCVEANTNTAMRDGLKAEGNQLPATAWLKALPYTKERPCLEFPDRACCSGAGPVSYTHLDVYKRQLPETSPRLSDAGKWPDLLFASMSWATLSPHPP